jgi:hypothetical protein
MRPCTLPPAHTQSLARKLCRNAWSRDGLFRDDIPASDPASLGVERSCKQQRLWGPSTYFVSHCWAYKLKVNAARFLLR